MDVGFGNPQGVGGRNGFASDGGDKPKYGCACVLARAVEATIMWTGKPKAVKCFNGYPIHLHDDPWWHTDAEVSILSYCQETSLWDKGYDKKLILEKKTTYTDVCGDQQPVTIRAFISRKLVRCHKCDCKSKDKPKTACFYNEEKSCEVNAPGFDDTPVGHIPGVGAGRVLGDLLPPPKDCPKPRWAKMLEEAKPWQLDDEGFKEEIAHWIHVDRQLDDDGKDAIDWGPYEYDGHPECIAAVRKKCCEPVKGFN